MCPVAHQLQGCPLGCSLRKEIGRLTQSLPPDLPIVCHTIRFIPKAQVPPNKKVTYLRIVANLRPQKVALLLLVTVLSTPAIPTPARSMSLGSGLVSMLCYPNPLGVIEPLTSLGFYLCHSLPEPEFMRIHASLFPQAYMDYNNFQPLLHCPR